MRTTITVILTAMALGSGLGALAQTPDGQTPAEETICSPLQDDGVTKGLYGLCVAFCEAQDITNEEVPISEEELAQLESTTPSGRILANYNKKRDKAGQLDIDPPMPCILVEEPCPCWTTDELNALGDGVLTAGTPSTSCTTYNSLNSDNFERAYIQEYDFTNNWEYEFADVIDWDADGTENPGSNFNRCLYRDETPGKPPIYRNLSIESGTLTQQQHESCIAQLETRIPSACQ